MLQRSEADKAMQNLKTILVHPTATVAKRCRPILQQKNVWRNK